MKRLVKLSIKQPRVVILCIVLITVFFGYIIFAKFAIEIDPTKSFSRKMDVIKYYHLVLKKFTMKDAILIGVENSKEGIFNVETLRYVEDVMNKLKNLTIKKKHYNIITKKEETIQVPSEISTNDIMSLINADDVTVNKATNTIVIGNLTRKARLKGGLTHPDPMVMDSLPKSDKELEKLIPFLKQELRNNELFQGILISVDEKACAIIVPIEKRLNNKIEIMRRELSLMVDALKLKKRFQGREFNFRSNIYNKTIDGITINDDFINETVTENKEKIKDFFTGIFTDIRDHYQEFYNLLETGEVNDNYLSMIFNMIETDAIYELEDVDITYEDTIDEIYDFVVNTIDIFSKNNLESKIYNVKDIYDVGYLYRLMKNIAKEDKPENIKTYIAGRPIAEALIEEFIINDMTIFLFFTVVVIMIILFLSFRTLTGVFLPLVSVIISVICLMGSMLLLGIEFSSGTITVPTILIAVGSAYVIHYLARYYEATLENGIKDVNEALIETTDNIHVAINLAAITTIAAFLSVTSSDVIDIKMLGILISIGIAFTVISTYSFVPAVLSLLPLPKEIKQTKAESVIMKGTMNIGELTYNHSRLVFFIAIGITFIIALGFIFLKTESSITYMFMENNPIRVADKFINKKLTGTGQMCIVFKMRDRVNIRSKTAQIDLDQRIAAFMQSYKTFIDRYPDLKGADAINTYFIADLENIKRDPIKNRDSIEKRVKIFSDILNEYYEIEPSEKEQPENESNREIDDLSSLSDDSAISKENGAYGETLSPVEKGIADIIKRIGTIDSDKEKKISKRYIDAIRKYKNSNIGKQFQGSFYYLSDFFETDIKQPITLRKLEILGKKLHDLQEPKAYIDETGVKPVGNILSITDPLKVIYKVFYHDDNDAFKKIPAVKNDGFQDKSLTDRSIIGVCINQFRSSREDIFKYLITDDLKLMQYVVFMRSDKAEFLKSFNDIFYKMADKIFPKDDPYVEKIVISGLPAINMAMNEQLYHQQIKSLGLTIFIVFLVCLFIFRSFAGGILSIIPISFTVIINLGIMGWLDFPISYSTVIIASIAIGAGIDYTIHFMERFKFERLVKGRDFRQAYFNTLRTAGRAIVISALSVAGGFAVLSLSTFKAIKVAGFMVALAMILSATASLTILPALMNWLKPKFLEKEG